MKIGFDVSQTGPSRTGCGVFTDSLLRALAAADRQNEYLLYPTFGDTFWDPEWSQTTRVDAPHVSVARAHESLEQAAAYWRSDPTDVDRALGAPDVVHANNFFCPRGLRRTRLVYTLYDVAVLEAPQFTTEANRLACSRGMFLASVSADAILAISHYTRGRFRELFPHYPASRIDVIYPASKCDATRVGKRPASLDRVQSEGFWLAVGTVEPRKNHLGLLEAYARQHAEEADARPLVIAGGPGWLMDDLETRVNCLGLKDRVIRAGYLSDDELRWAYEHCFALVYPSLYEGFGLPVLEAMSLGAPVITSSVTSLPEVAGDGALVVPPLTESLVEAMLSLRRSPRMRLEYSERARRQAARFTWVGSAQQTLEVYRRVTSQRRFAKEAGRLHRLRGAARAFRAVFRNYSDVPQAAARSARRIRRAAQRGPVA